MRDAGAPTESIAALDRCVICEAHVSGAAVGQQTDGMAVHRCKFEGMGCCPRHKRGESVRHWEELLSYLEALAVSRATVTLAPTLRAEEVATLHVIVDNTSVEAAVRRGIARSPTVNWALLGGLLELKELSIGVTIRYIKSGDNPADCVSRGAPVNLDRLSVVVDRMRRQGGREARCFPSTLTQSAKKNVIRALG